MRVSVFDSQAVVHKGLTSLLPARGHSVVSQALDGRDAVRVVREAMANVVVTDIRMPHADGLSVLEQLDESGLNVPIVVYTCDNNPTFVARAIVHGVRDFVLKTDPVDHLVAAIDGVSDADSVSQNTFFLSIRERMSSREIDHRNPRDLTNRELQVLRHLGFGLSNREIAKSLCISVETVKEHVQNILRKLDTKDRTAAAVWAVRDGLA